MADAPESAGGGTTLFESGTAFYNCLFIGETENIGTGNGDKFEVNFEYPVNSGNKVTQYLGRSFSKGMP